MLSPAGNVEVRLGDSLPGRVSEGEALLHPDILTILKLVRKKFPSNVIQANTNGTMLTKEFIEKLEEFNPMKLTISYHSDNSENWQKIFNLGEEHYRIARSSFLQLRMKKFFVEATIVPLPALVGYDDLEKTFDALRCFTQHVLIYAPGYSKLASESLKGILNVDYKELSEFFVKMRKKYKVAINFFSDPVSPINFYPFQYMQDSFNKKFKSVLWLLSEAAYERNKGVIDNYGPYIPNNHYAVKVKNYTYGGNINAAGLLLLDDFDRSIEKELKRLKEKNIKVDLLVIPKVAFDRFGDDLTGKNYSVLEEKYGLPLWLG